MNESMSQSTRYIMAGEEKYVIEGDDIMISKQKHVIVTQIYYDGLSKVRFIMLELL